MKKDAAVDSQPTSRTADLLRSPLAWADAITNRIYGWRLNPLYHSGTIVIVMLLLLLVSGLYLILFYRIGSPYASVTRISNEVFIGGWTRAIHRYAADVAVIAAIVHGWRMFAQGKSWGRRALAWTSGLILFGMIMVCGWTGYVMVWDAQGQMLAQEGARLIDALPLFSGSIRSTFAGGAALPAAFFFLNMFLHVALPVGLAAALYLHVSRVARPTLVPPKPLTYGLVGIVAMAGLLIPAPLGSAGDTLSIPGNAPFDFFYGFWLPISTRLSPWTAWGLASAGALLALATPFWSRPRRSRPPPPSLVDTQLCTACDQCAVDCPYEAITMIPRHEEGRASTVAFVDNEICVSCGICAGSCAPMGVGPPARTGRDQLSWLRGSGLLSATPKRPESPIEIVHDQISTNKGLPNSSIRDRVVIIACTRGAGKISASAEFQGSPVIAVECAGNLHTSIVEFLVRSGAAGVMIASCPPRDCWNREGSKWLVERLYHDREAELQARVDRDRVTVAFAGEKEKTIVHRHLDRFRKHIQMLESTVHESSGQVEIDAECSTGAESADL